MALLKKDPYVFFSLVVKRMKKPTKYLLFFVLFSLKGSPPMLKLDFGLWTLSPRFSAVLPHPEPTTDFSNCSAVSHPKTRDFRFKPRDFRFRWRPFRFQSCDLGLQALFTPGQWCYYAQPHNQSQLRTGVCMQINVGNFAIWALFTTNQVSGTLCVSESFTWPLFLKERRLKLEFDREGRGWNKQINRR